MQDAWTITSCRTHLIEQAARRFYIELYATTPEQDGKFYFQDFSSYTNEAISFDPGSSFVSTHLGSAAEIRDSTIKELQLTEKGTGNTRSAFMLPEFDTDIVYSFSAKWNMIVDGNFQVNSGGNGVSFNFGHLAGLNLTDSAYNQETGYGIGLSVNFITGITGTPGVYIRAGTNTLAYFPAFFDTLWGQNSNKRHFIEVDWHYLDGLTLRINQTTIFANITTYGFHPQRGARFVWAARTDGTYNEQIRLDNIVVTTGGRLERETPGSSYYDEPGGLNVTHAFDNNDTTGWQSYTSINTQAGATLPAKRSARVYALTSSGDVRGRDPRDWRLEGSADGGGLWNVLDTRTGYFANGSETRAYLTTNVAAFQQVRLNVVTNNGHPYTFLNELRNYRFSPSTNEPTLVLRPPANGSQFNQVVSSDDGRVVYATLNSVNGLQQSSDFGVTWDLNGAPNQVMFGLACSSDGQRVIAVSQNQRIRYSTNSGASFVQLGNAPLAPAFAELAISSNGSVMAMGGQSMTISYSTNSGANWAASDSPNTAWSRIAMSDDGRRLYAVGTAVGIYSSNNSGANWVSNNVWSSSGFYDVACSRDGMKAVVAGGTYLYTTTNGGATWNQIFIPVLNIEFQAVACSADGRIMYALDRRTVGLNRTLYLSTDFGATWSILFEDPQPSWRSLACSGDGQFLFIGAGLGCYTYHLLPRPPYVEEGYATDIGPFGATLNARIRPFGAPTRAFFSYGTTTNLGNNVNFMGGNSTGIEVITVSYPITGLQTNTTYYFRPAATNTTGLFFGLGTNSSFTTLSLAGLDAWRYQYFGTTNNAGDAADDADPEGDNNRNLLEFASGTSPSATNGSPLFRIGESNGSPRVYFTKDATADGHVVWQIESTPEPSTTWSNRNGAMQEVDSNGNLRTIEFAPDEPSTSGEQYRLKVSRP